MKRLFILTVLIFGGCQQAEKKDTATKATVHGQIFVIRNDRENVKLGGVTVYYVNTDDLRERSTWIAQNIERLGFLRDYRSNLADATTWLNKTSKERVFQPEFHTFIRQLESVLSTANQRFMRNPILGEIDRLERVRQINENLFESTDFRSDPDSQWIVGSIYFDWLKSHSTTSAETNADGNFSFSIPPSSKGFVLARASRLLRKDQEEHYYWLKEVSGKEDQELMLSSTGTATRETLKNVMNLTEASQRSSLALFLKEFDLIPLDWIQSCERILRQIKSNELTSSAIDDKIKTLEENINRLKFESTP